MRRLILCGAVLSLLTACTSPGATWHPARASASGPPPASTTVAAPPTITLAFGGDVHFTGRTLKLLDNPQTAFGSISSVLSAADISMVNFESAVTDRGTPEPKTFHFRAPVTAFDALKGAGIDVATLANNHALDYGRVGLDDTLAAAKAADFPIVGEGENADQAFAPYIANVKGIKIAFLGMSQIAELASSWKATDTRSGLAMAFDVPRAVAAVKAARARADVVVVFMHWGIEYNKCVSSQQKSLAKQLAAAGATMIVGSHVHLMQGDGWLGKTYVAYGLSNFLWWLNDAKSNDTGVIRVTLTGTKITKTEFLPAYINRTTGQPEIVTGAKATQITQEHADLRSCTGLAAEPS